MKTVLVLTRRNIKMYFKDKGLFLSSLLVPLILLVLYTTFLANVYRQSFTASVPEGFVLDDKIINGLVASQLFSSLLAVCPVTVAFCANVIMVQDKYLGVKKDLTASPVKSSALSVSYYTASVAVTLIVNFTALAASFVYVACVGWYMTFGDVMLLVLDVFLLTMFGVALSSLINMFLTTQGQISAVSTVISACYGFICGAYMPISQFGSDVLQKILSFLPSTYGTSMIKNHAMRGVFAEMLDSGFPEEAVVGIKQSVDASFEFFGQNVSVGAMVAVLVSFTAVVLGAYILLNALRKKRV